MRRNGRWAVLLLLFAVAACASPRERRPVPRAQSEAAHVPGFPGVRFWGDKPDAHLQEDLTVAFRANVGGELLGNPPSFLAISGGAADGAFGAGFLCGWTKTGTRPTFNVVTGISTGALIAPFAFVGPDYDKRLRRAFTKIGADDVYRIRGVFSLVNADSVASSNPLRKQIEKFVDRELMARVAEAHRAGRRLLIGTTNLDAQRPVIWNMGAIATRGGAKALALFRKVLLASASIPGAFPPAYFTVRANGQTYDEMHVDGGLVRGVFFHGGAIDVGRARKDAGGISLEARPTLYVLKNGMVAPQYTEVEARLLPIVGKTVLTLIKAQTGGDLFRIFLFCRRDGFEFRLAHIPNDYERIWPDEFDRREMNRVFDLGYELASGGYRFRDHPPGYR